MERRDNVGRWEAMAWLLAILVVGVGFRLVYAWYSSIVDLDTATVGYMAQNILQGDRPVFFYGQNYMGALEAYVSAGSLALFGSSEFTITLGTVLFAGLWIIAMYLLFSELANRRTGIWLAAFTAVPGYAVMRYTTEPYGGYSIAMFSGTMALWIAVRIQQRHPRGKTMLWHALALGFFSGLGLWTHLSVGPFLAVAGLLCFVHLCQTRRSGVFFSYVAGAAIAILGLLPGFLLRNTFTGSHTTSFVFTGEHMSKSWRILFNDNLDQMISWDIGGALLELGWVPTRAVGDSIESVFEIAMTALVGVGILFYLVVLISKRRIALASPLLLTLVFLATFLPHSLAHEASPRYVLALWTAGLAGMALMGLNNISRRIPTSIRSPLVGLATGMALLFLVGVFLGQEEYLFEKAPDAHTERQMWVKRAAEGKKSGAEVIFMVAGDREGHKGQISSFYAEGEPRFLNAFDDRVQHHAQDAELRHAGWTVENSNIGTRLQNSFDEIEVPYISNYSFENGRALVYQQDTNTPPANPVLHLVHPSNLTVSVFHIETRRNHPQNVPDQEVTLAKTAYAGHDEGKSCPAASAEPTASLVLSRGDPVTYCYTITNHRDTDILSLHLDDVHINPIFKSKGIAAKLAPKASISTYVQGRYQPKPERQAIHHLNTEETVISYQVHTFEFTNEMTDWNHNTSIDQLLAVEIQSTQTFAAAEQPILWLTSAEPLGDALPNGYHFFVRKPGATNRHQSNDCRIRISQTYRIGKRAFVKGYFPKQDIYARSVTPINNIKMTQNHANRGPWNLNEIFIFTRDPSGAEYADTSAAYQKAKAMIQAGELDFVYADRIQSAQLIHDLDDDSVAFPRYNPKRPATMISREVLPRARTAVLVHAALEQQCRDVITKRYGPRSVVEKDPPAAKTDGTDPYSLIILRNFKVDDRTEGLIWNGHTVLEAADPDALVWH